MRGMDRSDEGEEGKVKGFLPGFFLVVDDNDQLVIVPDTIGMQGAKRFRTREHAEVIRHALTGERDLRRNFGPGAEA